MVLLINHQTSRRGSFLFSGGLGKQSCYISSANGHRSLRILRPFPEKDFLPLFRKCQHTVTDDSHLSYRYRSGTNSHCSPWLKCLLNCQRPKSILSLFFFPNRPGQTVPLHQAKRYGVLLDLAARSQQPGVSSPSKTTDPVPSPGPGWMAFCQAVTGEGGDPRTGVVPWSVR